MDEVAVAEHLAIPQVAALDLLSHLLAALAPPSDLADAPSHAPSVPVPLVQRTRQRPSHTER